MSADKHRSLARRVAYLRLAAARGDTGFAVQIKWGYAITPDVEALEGLGYLRRSRNSAGGRKRVTCMVITPSGDEFVQRTVARRSQDFGPVSLIRQIDPRKIRKDEKRKATSQAGGYTSRRVYSGVRLMDPASTAQHLDRVRRAMTLPESIRPTLPAFV